MRNYYKTGGIKISSGILAGMMLIVMLFSSFFISAHADHDCKEADCPICACIRQCENSIRSTGGIAAVSAIVMPVFIALRFISFDVPQLKRDTPVSAKVRLNN